MFIIKISNHFICLIINKSTKIILKLITNELTTNISNSSDDDEDSFVRPREQSQINSSGFSDFCIRNIGQHAFGRREIELAANEMPGI
jgi:adenosylhomocysteinase